MVRLILVVLLTLPWLGLGYLDGGTVAPSSPPSPNGPVPDDACSIDPWGGCHDHGP